MTFFVLSMLILLAILRWTRLGGACLQPPPSLCMNTPCT
jgi:hypothetical protein